MEKLWNYEKIGAPSKEGNFTYYSKNDGLQVMYRKDLEGIFLDLIKERNKLGDRFSKTVQK
jgi:prolyl oligopeptidase